MSLFRCEEMSLHQLFMQSEAAYTCVGEMGEVGLVQFRDMNPEVNAFQRRFVGEVRRCDEMERKIRFIEKEIKKESVIVIPEAHTSTVPPSREMNELESKLEKLENELRELLQNQEQLQKNFLELTELKEVLLRTQTFFVEGGRAESGHRFDLTTHVDAEGESDGLLTGMDNSHHDQTSGLKLGVVAGVINRDRLGAFERVLWRVCRGNVYLKQTDIEMPLVDPKSGEQLLKSVFIVFFQGEQLGSRVKKICEGFRATLYPCPEAAGERREMLTGVESRIADLRTVLDQTLAHRTRVLETAATNLSQWMVQTKKIKAIFHTLNLFQVSHKYLQVQCWIPNSDVPIIQAALDRGTESAGSSVPCVLTRIATREQPPTFNRNNKFTSGFQNIIDAYGVATYREINPMPFTVITFPFLFAVMFGDAGHGAIMAMFAGLLIWRERDIIASKSKNEIFMMFFGGRYVILLMGVFSIYTGFMYNDVFSKSVNLFGSQWDVKAQKGDIAGLPPYEGDITLNPAVTYKGASPYPFGFDPIWQVAENKLLFMNSFKMKCSVILGVFHMMFGIWLSFFNHTYFQKPLNIVAEFIPQVLFLGCLFGYLVLMIFFKWLTFDCTNSADAPNLLTTLIDMFMAYGKSPALPLYTGQTFVQSVLVLVAAVCVPWMLILKPLILFMNHRNPRAGYTIQGLSFKNLNRAMNAAESDQVQGLIDNEELDTAVPSVITSDPAAANGLNSEQAISGENGAGESSGAQFNDEEEFDFGNIMILQSIHTIEFCLGCISHTASYLRLWALSLAHAELSEVLWSMVMRIGITSRGMSGALLMIPVFGFWAILTIAILLLMEGLSAFLHALRLHWVEFQSKFYKGEGYIFAPFTFQHIMDNPFEE